MNLDETIDWKKTTNGLYNRITMVVIVMMCILIGLALLQGVNAFETPFEQVMVVSIGGFYVIFGVYVLRTRVIDFVYEL